MARNRGTWFLHEIVRVALGRVIDDCWLIKQAAAVTITGFVVIILCIFSIVNSFLKMENRFHYNSSSFYR